MERIELCNIKGAYEISSSADYIVFSGPRLIIYRRDGTFVASRKDLGMVRKCVFTSPNTILVDYSAMGFYSLISLIDGLEIWHVSQPKVDYTCSRFALSPDKRYAYDRYDLRGNLYYLKIDLLSGTLYKQRIKHKLRCVSDLVCDQHGNPVFLEQHYEENDDNFQESISKNRISCICATDTKSSRSFKQIHQWEFQHPRIARYFLGQKDAVLTQDLQVYNPDTGEMYSLIENEQTWGNPGRSIASYRLEANTPYITLMYDTVNVVVDLSARKMIARYAAEYRFGCIIGNEYWVCTDEGILKKPFPYIDNIPVRKHIFWSP